MAVTKKAVGAKPRAKKPAARSAPAVLEAAAAAPTPEPAKVEGEQEQAAPASDPAGVPEIEVKVSTFRVEPDPPKVKRGQAPARASYYLVPQTGELFNRPGKGWVELTPEQTAVAEVLPRRKRAAWWRQQQRKEAERAAGR